MQSNDLIETYMDVYGRSKDLVSEKEGIECNNMVKQHKKWWTLMVLQRKTNNNIIQIGHQFLIIHTEYQ